MSLRAIVWAFDQDVGRSPNKFVLVALADNATANGLAWPSIKAICRKTNMDRKTVIRALDELEKSGLLVDSGKRVGQTKQIKVYRFPISDEEQTVPDAALLNSPAFPIKQSRKRDTESVNESIHSLNAPLLLPIWKDRLAAIYGRRKGTKWSADEVKAFEAVVPIDDDELALVERYYAANRNRKDNVCRTVLLRLLRHWPGEVDRARAWCERNPLPGARRVVKLKRADLIPDSVPPDGWELPGQDEFLETFERQHGRLPYGWERKDGKLVFTKVQRASALVGPEDSARVAQPKESR